MVNKVIAATVLGVFFVLYSVVNGWVIDQGGGSDASLVYMIIIAAFILVVNPPEATDIVGSCLGSVTNILWFILWVGIADFIWLTYHQVTGDGFDVMAQVWNVAFIASTLITSALIFGGLRTLVKSE